MIGIFFISVSIWILSRFKTNSKHRISSNRIPTIGSRSREYSTDFSGSNELGIGGQQGNGQELSLYSFSYVAAATNNFSDENKLGQGGFGHVYKVNFFGPRINLSEVPNTLAIKINILIKKNSYVENYKKNKIYYY